MTSRILASSILLLAVGCGSSGFAPVSGRVTLDGQALPNATVAFQPDKANPGAVSEGVTDADGNYTLHTIPKNRNGAIPGKHKVTISAMAGMAPASGANPKPRKDRVPAQYNTQSKLTFDVPAAGTSAANFDLKTK